MVDDEILRQFGEGMSMTELAEKYGCSVVGIRHRLLKNLTPAEIHDAIMTMRRAGISRTRHHLNPRTSAGRAAEAVAMYRDGKTLQQIGERFGVSRERVRQWIVASGEATKNLKAQRVPDLELVEPIAQCAACLGTVWADRGKKSKGAKYPTCSPECHEDWALARYYFHPDTRREHRVSIAKALLNSPQRLNSYQRRHYAKILSGAKIRSHFQFDQPREGTRTRAAYDRVMRKRAENLAVRVEENVG